MAFRYFRPGTSGTWTNRTHAAAERDRIFPSYPTAAPAPTTVLVDLRGIDPTVGVLQDFLLTAAQRVQGGFYGDVKIVVSAGSQALADLVGSWADAHQLPLYVAVATPGDEVVAKPHGALTPTDRATLDALQTLGGQVSASALADAVGLEPNAANNRLAGLEKRGYVFRVRQPGRDGDIFVDPRAPSPERAVTVMLKGLSQVLDGEAYRRTEALLLRTLREDYDAEGQQVY